MKKLLVLMLTLGLVCLVSVAFAQDPLENKANDNEDAAIAQDGGTAVGVEVEETGAAANDNSSAIGVEDFTAAANDTSSAVGVEDFKAAANDTSFAGNVEKGSAGAQNQSTAQDADAAAYNGTAVDATAGDGQAYDNAAAGDDAVANNGSNAQETEGDANNSGNQANDNDVDLEKIALGSAVEDGDGSALDGDQNIQANDNKVDVKTDDILVGAGTQTSDGSQANNTECNSSAVNINNVEPCCDEKGKKHPRPPYQMPADEQEALTDSTIPVDGLAGGNKDNTINNGAAGGSTALSGVDTTNVMIPDATVQGLAKQQADDGSYNIDQSLNADAYAEAGGVAQDGLVNDNTNMAGNSGNAQDGLLNLNTSPVQVRLVGDQNDAVAMDNGVANEEGALAQGSGAGAMNFNTYVPPAEGVGVATGAADSDDSSASAACCLPGPTEVNNNGAAGYSTAFQMNDVGEAENFAAGNSGDNSPIQVRSVEDNNNSAVAMDSGVALDDNTFQGPIAIGGDAVEESALADSGSNAMLFNGAYDTAAAMNSTAMGGYDNTNINVPDLTLGLGGNAAGGASQAADAIANGSGPAQDVSSDSTGVQTGNTSPVQVRETDALSSAVAMDNGKAMETSVFSTAAMDNGKAQDGYANAMDNGKAQDAFQAAMDNGINQKGDLNANNLTTSPIQYRDVDNEDDGTVAMDNAKAFGEVDDGGAAAMDQARAFGYNEKGAQASDQALAVRNDDGEIAWGGGTAVDNPTQSPVATGGSIAVRNEDGEMAWDGGLAIDNPQDTAIANGGSNANNFSGAHDVGIAGSSNKGQGGNQNNNAMDGGQAQKVEGGSVGIQASSTSPIQYRETQNNDDGTIAMDQAKAVGENEDGAAAFDNGIAIRNDDGEMAANGSAAIDAGSDVANVIGANGMAAEGDDAVAVGGSIAVDQSDDGSVAIGGTTALAIGENEDGAAVIGSGQAYRNDDGEMAIGCNAVAMDIETGGTGIVTGDTSPVQYRDTEAKDFAAIGMDNANVVSNPTNSAVVQGTGIAIDDTNDSAFTTGANSPALADNTDFAISNSGPAFKDVHNASSVGAGNNAQETINSAVAQGSVAVNQSSDLAATNSGPAANISSASGAINQGAGQSAFQNATNASAVNGAGLAAGISGQGAVAQNGDALFNNGDGSQAKNGSAFTANQGGSTNSAAAQYGDAMANFGEGAQAKNGDAMNNTSNGVQAKNGDATAAYDDAAVGVGGSKVISHPQEEALIDSTQVKDGGQLAVGTTSGCNLNVQVPVQVGTNNLQTVALTELKQVNAGIYVGNGSGNTSGTMSVSSNNASSVGLQVLSYNHGGVAANVASQNVINVSNNVGQGCP